MDKVFNLLIINTGSTSTKVSIYENEEQKYFTSIFHSSEELSKYNSINDQYEMRKNALLKYIQKIGYNLSKLSAIVSRGGSTPPLEGGAYIINDLMVDRLSSRPVSHHAGNIGPILAWELANQIGVKAYIYDSVAVDELNDIAKISGLSDIERVSLVHVLNSRYAAKEVAKKYSKSYDDMNIIVAHIGGGITITIHGKGKIVDVVGDDEGPFSPERCGGLPTRQLVNLCFSGKYKSKEEMHKAMRSNGGLISYLGTNSALKVEQRISNGDKYAEKIYYAMAYQISKGIAELSAVVNGSVDAIVLTGGIANSKIFTSWIEKKVKFIAPVIVIPGENELKSLCYGCLRVLRGAETPHEYIENK